jgi:hypothetical protein
VHQQAHRVRRQRLGPTVAGRARQRPPRARTAAAPQASHAARALCCCVRLPRGACKERREVQTARRSRCRPAFSLAAVPKTTSGGARTARGGGRGRPSSDTSASPHTAPVAPWALQRLPARRCRRLQGRQMGSGHDALGCLQLRQARSALPHERAGWQTPARNCSGVRIRSRIAEAITLRQAKTAPPPWQSCAPEPTAPRCGGCALPER